MLVYPVRQANIKTRCLKAGASPVTKVTTKIRSVKLTAKDVIRENIKIQKVNQRVRAVLVGNIPTRPPDQNAKAAPKVGIKTKINKEGAKNVKLVHMLPVLADLHAQVVGNDTVDSIGSHPLPLVCHLSMHVTSINRVHGKVTGREIVGQRAMHRERHPVDMVIIGESVATTSKITFVMAADCFVVGVQLEMPDVIHHQKEDLG